VNVAFSGQQIVNGTEESHGWLTDNESHCDAYSKTKQEAEKIVFWANGKLNALGEQLQTCTLRFVKSGLHYFWNFFIQSWSFL